jgi:hypothetical protein
VILVTQALVQKLTQFIQEKAPKIIKVSISESTFILVDKGGQERKRKTISYTKLSSNGVDNTLSTKFLSPADAKDFSWW